MRIAYFINQYPKVSHSFIRREILAMERRGCEVLRVAIRGWDAELVDEQDIIEQEKTHYILKNGLTGLLDALLRCMLLSPIRFISSLILATRLGWRADRPLIYHYIYLAEACRLLLLLKQHQSVHVHAHFGTNSAEVVMLAHRLGGPPYSFTVHGPEEFDKPQAIKLADKIRQSAFVVAISAFGRSQLLRLVEHQYWSKIKIVHCGLEPGFYEGVDNSYPLAPRLICVGRLCEQKGQLLLVEAARMLSAKGINFEIVLAGDGEMRPDIESLIREYGLEKKISITGWISSDEVRTQILAARALILPSFAEGLPVVIMEAMALKRPVLTTYIAGIPELVENRVNGFLVEAGSVEVLAQAIETMLLMNPDQLKEMGETAYLKVTKRHDIDTEAAKLIKLFRNAAA
ncbi:MAG: glycosyltransferase [Nitrosomonadales bacterium]|nr:glycosyltransferase [Nitrosomonadales bacterium]